MNSDEVGGGSGSECQLSAVTRSSARASYDCRRKPSRRAVWREEKSSGVAVPAIVRVRVRVV
jgi:hypothetical protein